MNVLVIGGTGFISQRLTARLLETGNRVTLLNRGVTPNPFRDQPHLSTIRGNRDDEQVLQQAIRDDIFDVVYDFVGYGPEQMEMVVRVLPGRVGRYIFCSTISVYMISDEVQCPITEDQDQAPIMPNWDRNPFGMDYGINKRRCEEVLWNAYHEQRFPVSMLRPTFVCGPGDPTRRDYFWIQRLLDRRPLLVPGSGDHAFQQVYVEDVARTFYNLLDEKSSIGEAYNVASEEIFSLNKYLKALGELLSVKPEIVHISQKEFDRLDISIHPKGDVFPFNTRRIAIFSLDKITRDLNFKSTPFGDWMAETITWYLSKYNGDSIGYEHRGKEIEVINKLGKEQAYA